MSLHGKSVTSVQLSLERQDKVCRTRPPARAEFDDAALFQNLQEGSRRLLGRWAPFCARKIGGIKVRGYSTHAADAAFGWIRSSDSWSLESNCYTEEQLYRHFLHPELGDARYAWVRSARNVAFAAKAAQTTVTSTEGAQVLAKPFLGTTHAPSSLTQIPAGDLEVVGSAMTTSAACKRDVDHNDDVEGLELVLVWNARRICVAAGLVASISIALFCVLASVGSSAHNKAWSLETAGDAFSSASYSLLIGQAMVMSWLWVSYLVM